MATDTDTTGLERPPQDFFGRRRAYGPSTCFLCGRRLGTRNRSDEHVFPKWLQRRFDLWDQMITLLNDTALSYRQLTVPCCTACNSGDLAALEGRISRAVLCGPDAVRSLSSLDVYLWMAKIYYSILYKEYLLPRNRGSRDRRRIVPRRLLDELHVQIHNLQATRSEVEFLGDPGSVTVLRLQCRPDVRYQFTFNDYRWPRAATCRLGSVGIIVLFQDAGIVGDLLKEFLADFLDKDLHPLQFYEIVAHFLYNCSRMENQAVPLYVESYRGKYVIPNMPRMSQVPIFGDWDLEAFSRVLAGVVDLPLDKVYLPPRGYLSWLLDADGNFRHLDINDGFWPYPRSLPSSH